MIGPFLQWWIIAGERVERLLLDQRDLAHVGALRTAAGAFVVAVADDAAPGDALRLGELLHLEAGRRRDVAAACRRQPSAPPGVSRAILPTDGRKPRGLRRGCRPGLRASRVDMSFSGLAMAGTNAGHRISSALKSSMSSPAVSGASSVAMEGQRGECDQIERDRPGRARPGALGEARRREGLSPPLMAAPIWKPSEAPL